MLQRIEGRGLWAQARLGEAFAGFKLSDAGKAVVGQARDRTAHQPLEPGDRVGDDGASPPRNNGPTRRTRTAFHPGAIRGFDPEHRSCIDASAGGRFGRQAAATPTRRGHVNAVDRFVVEIRAVFAELTDQKELQRVAARHVAALIGRNAYGENGFAASWDVAGILREARNVVQTLTANQLAKRSVLVEIDKVLGRQNLPPSSLT